MAFSNNVSEAALLAGPSQLPFELEMARLIVESLQLEADPAGIVPGEALFVDGLGLDSIDALELALAISKRYGLDLKSDDARNREIFGSLRQLAAHVALCRTR
jgi:acyl carrier protein